MTALAAHDPDSIARQWWRWYPHTFAQVVSGGEFRVYRHVAYIGQRIAEAIARGNGRLLINLGPGTGKSTLLCKWLPVWLLEHWPDWRIISATNTLPLARKWAGDVRNEFAHNPLLTTKLSEDTAAKDEWRTAQGGGMKAIGVGVAVMGWRANVLIVDDPYGEWADAWSPTYRRNVEEWFSATANSRLEPGASIVVLHHRMHPKDLTHYILAGENGCQWEHICLPSLARANDPLGRRPGEALCPERYDERALDLQRADMRGPAFEAMHQQNPQEVGPGNAYRWSAENEDARAELRPDLPLDWLIDFNRTPSMHLLLGQYDPVADRFAVVWELRRSRSLLDLLREFEDWMRARGGFVWPALRLFGDATGSTRATQTGESDYAVIRRRLDALGLGAKVRMMVPRANPAIVNRVNAVNEALRDTADGRVHLVAHPRCEAFVRDMREQQLTPDGLLDEHDPMLGHAGAAVGYWVYRLRPIRMPIPVPQGRFGV